MLGETGDLAHRGAVSVERELVVGTERFHQRLVSLIHLLQGYIGHSGVEDNGHRKQKWVAGEIGKLLWLAIFVGGEILRKQAIHAPAIGPHHHRNLQKARGDVQGVEIFLGIEWIARSHAALRRRWYLR